MLYTCYIGKFGVWWKEEMNRIFCECGKLFAPKIKIPGNVLTYKHFSKCFSCRFDVFSAIEEAKTCRYMETLSKRMKISITLLRSALVKNGKLAFVERIIEDNLNDYQNKIKTSATQSSEIDISRSIDQNKKSENLRERNDSSVKAIHLF